MSSGSGLGCGPPVSSAQPSRCASGLRLNRLGRFQASRQRSGACRQVRALGAARQCLTASPQGRAGRRRLAASPRSLAVKPARPRLPGLASHQQSVSSGSGLGCGPPVSSAQPLSLRFGLAVKQARPRFQASRQRSGACRQVRAFGCSPAHQLFNRKPAGLRRKEASSRESPLANGTRPEPTLVPTYHRRTPAEHVVRRGPRVRPAGVQRAALSLRFGLAVKQARPRFQASRLAQRSMSSGAGLGCGPPVSSARSPSRCASGLRLNRLVRASRPRVSAAEHVVRLRALGAARRCPGRAALSLRFGLAVKQARPRFQASRQRSGACRQVRALGAARRCLSAQPSRCASGLRLNRLVRASRPHARGAEHVVRCGPWVRPAGV